MKNSNDFFYHPRKYNQIPLWKDVTAEQWYDPEWQKKNAVKTVEDLKQIIQLSEKQATMIEETVRVMRSEGKDPLRISPYYASLMQENPFDPDFFGDKTVKRVDPVFWQSVPTPANLLFPNAGKEAAMKEGSRSFGVAYQRYPNRVALLVAENSSCASYCVHCQRAKSLDCSVEIGKREIDEGIFYVNYNSNINEVLVTGGDALMISRKRLSYILEELSKIPHLRTIRIATRVPVVMPMAITDDLLQLIKESSNRYNKGIDKYVYFMTHVNHFQEITEDFAQAIKKISQHGFTVRNQTVLLNHVNDSYRTLAETFRRMFWVGVHPYYLLQCHKERGLAHFIVPIQVGKIYMKHLQGWLSGITMPRYAVNIEGGGGKVLLMPSGHDTLNVEASIDAKISESFADVFTWDHKRIIRYEALGRATRKEYDKAVDIMNDFIGKKGYFYPKLIIIDKDGNHITTTNRTRLPSFEKSRKSELLGYEIHTKGMPLTNPADIHEELIKKFNS